MRLQLWHNTTPDGPAPPNLSPDSHAWTVLIIHPNVKFFASFGHDLQTAVVRPDCNIRRPQHEVDNVRRLFITAICATQFPPSLQHTLPCFTTVAILPPSVFFLVPLPHHPLYYMILFILEFSSAVHTTFWYCRACPCFHAHPHSCVKHFSLVLGCYQRTGATSTGIGFITDRLHAVLFQFGAHLDSIIFSQYAT